ncbi:hypothetical protein AB0L75_40570 [Streptomyces sp. NPDC052101]|uniref:hypothetical protein n=1 Tax=Streptomyces sp. NPDC052101 TaxID=3155763 RepID=UPI0034315A2A
MTVLVLGESADDLERWASALPGERMVGVTGDARRPARYEQVVQVGRYTDSTEVELAAVRIARETPLSAIVASGYADLLRAACLRAYLGVPGQGREAALACIDLISLRAVLAAADVAVVPGREVRSAADVARHANSLGLPLRLRRRRVPDSPVAHRIDSRGQLLAVLRTTRDLSGLLAEPVLDGEPLRLPLDTELGTAVLHALPDSAGPVAAVHALRLPDGQLLVDHLELESFA